jgi:hypothetical protein
MIPYLIAGTTEDRKRAWEIYDFRWLDAGFDENTTVG